MGLLLKKRVNSDGSLFILYEMTLIPMGGKNANDRVASPEIVPIHLKVAGYLRNSSPLIQGETSFVTPSFLSWSAKPVQDRIYSLRKRETISFQS